MSSPALACGLDLETRARRSCGSSSAAIHRMVASALSERGIRGGHVVDVGCGGGALWHELSSAFDSYCGLDAVRFDGFPEGADFFTVDLDCHEWPRLRQPADVVTAVEIIEHLENPWAFVRAVAGLAKPGGWIVITTPNQLSALSLLTLLIRHRFSAFQDAHFPVHRTALLPSDLERAFAECGLELVEVSYSRRSRIPLTPWHYPRLLGRLFPCALSDNMMAIGRVPRG